MTDQTYHTTVHLLRDARLDGVKLIIDALEEYSIKHHDKKCFCDATIAQVRHCLENFTEPYKRGLQ